MPEQKAEKPIKKIEVSAHPAAHAESEPAPVRRYRAGLFQVARVLVAVAFAGLTFLVKSMPVFTIDLQITRAVQVSHAFTWANIGPATRWELICLAA